MKFLMIKSDLLAVGLSAVIIATFSALLYADYTRKVTVSGAEEVGVITFKKKVAQRMYSGQVIWEDVEQKSPVYNNDTIRTSDISEAIIELRDGTSIELDENSMILIAQSAGAININFEHGTIYAKRGDIGEKDVKALNIMSKDTLVSFARSDLKLSRAEGEEKKIDLVVSKGDAKINTGKQEKVVTKDQRVVISLDTREAKVDDLKLVLTGPSPNRYFVTRDPRQAVNFGWNEVKNKTLYLEIAADGGFRKLTVEREVKGTSAADLLPPGTWHWRLSAVDRASGKRDYSESRKFNIIRDVPVVLTYPQNNHALDYAGTPPIINFRWQKNDLALEYILEISADANFASILKTVQTPLTGLAVDNIAEGTYFWRVRTRVEIGETGYNGTSAVHRLTVNRKKTMEPAALVAPPDRVNIGSLMFLKKGQMFSWSSPAQMARYELVISRDQAFKDIAYRVSVDSNFAGVQTELKPGTYYWRVHTLGETPELSATSAIRVLSVVQTDAIKLIAPGKESSIRLAEEQNSVDVDFSWSKTAIDGVYQFELSRDQGFLTLDRSQRLPGTAVKMPKLGAGRYFWRIRLLDNGNNDIMVSDTGVLAVTVPEKKIEPVIPVGADADKKDATAPEKKTEPEKRKTVLSVQLPVKEGAIYVNGRYRGKGSVKADVEPGKNQTVTVTARGFEKYTVTVVVADGELKEIKPELVKEKALDRVKWIQEMGSPIMVKPAYHKNLIIIGTVNGNLICLNREGGRMWTVNLERRIESTPVFTGNVMYVVSNNENLYAINVYNGKILWKFKLLGTLLFESSPVVEGNRIIVASSYGRVYAISAAGKELWHRDIQSGIFSSPAYRNNMVYVGSEDNYLYALSAENGRVKWKLKMDGRVIASSPLTEKGIILIGTYAGTFYGIDMEKGKSRWTFKTGDSILSSPVVFSGKVYFGSNDEKLYCLNVDDGKLVWKFNTGEKVIAKPAVLNNTIGIASGNTLFILDANTGREQWVHRFPNRIKTSAVTAYDDLVVGLENGQVASLRSNLRVIVK